MEAKARCNSRSRAVLAALAIGTISCAPRPEVALLSVSSVTPAQIARGDVLRLMGGDFPPGRDAEITLAGTFRRPGAEPSSVLASLVGRAVSAETVQAEVGDGVIRALGGRGTFRGHVTVRFRAYGHDDHTVVGRSGPITVDVSDTGRRAVTDELVRARASRAWLEYLGASIGEEAPEVPGLPVDDVVDGSRADAAGLAAGDRLLQSDGLELHAACDLVPIRGRNEASVEVSRETDAAPFVLRLPVPPQEDMPTFQELSGAPIAVAWMLLTLIFFAPTASLFDRRHRALVHAEIPHAPAPTRRGPALMRRVSNVLIALAIAATLVALDRRVPLSLEVLVLGAGGLNITGAWIARSGSTFFARALAVARPIAATIASAMAFGVVAALEGTTELSALGARQGDAPWAWAITTSPIAPFAFLLFAWSASLTSRTASARKSAERFARAIDRVGLATSCAIAAAVFLGGFGASDGAPSWRVITFAAYLAKSTLLFVCIARARSVSRASSAWLTVAALAALVAGLAFLQIAYEPSAELVRGLGRVVALALAIAGLAAAVRFTVTAAPRPPVPSHPFL